MPLTLRAGAATDIGQVRQVNQDAFLVTDALWAVADGMGGHAAGEVASAEALAALGRGFGRPDSTALVDAVQTANLAVVRRGRDDPELRGMGTTLCAIAVVEEPATGDAALAVVNVGDSRVYRLVTGELEQLTRDHKLVQDLVDAGELSPADAAVHPSRSVLTRALGIDDELDVDSWVVLPVRGERYLLCSDGLYDEVDDREIAAVLASVADPAEAARELVRRANAAGGHDNITVIVADVVDDDGRLDTSTAAIAQHRPPARDAAGGRSTSTATATAAATSGDLASPAAARSALGATARSAEAATAHRRVTPWRTVAFLGAVAAVVAVAVGATAWYARNTYYVGVDDTSEEIVIFRGRPGGVLWFDPTVAERTELTLAEIPAARVDDVVAGKTEPSLTEARRYVAHLAEESDARGVTTSTTGGTDGTDGTDATGASPTTAASAASGTAPAAAPNG